MDERLTPAIDISGSNYSPTDINSQWRESWKSMRTWWTIPQQWSLLTVSKLVKGTAGPVERLGASLTCALVVRPKRCPTSSNPAKLNMVCLSFTLLIMLLHQPGVGFNSIHKVTKWPVADTYQIQRGSVDVCAETVTAPRQNTAHSHQQSVVVAALDQTPPVTSLSLQTPGTVQELQLFYCAQ